MSRLSTVLSAPLLLAALNAQAADQVAGKQIFDRVCAECHAPGSGHPGTQQLGWTRGATRAVLEQRLDLSPEYVAVVVRNGLVEMPAIRPTELSDAELRQVSSYLFRTERDRKAP